MKIAQQKWRNFSGKVFNQPIAEIVENAIIREKKTRHNLKIYVYNKL